VTARVAVVVFPGSNCEHDAVEGIRAAGGEAELVWHGARSLEGFDAVVLPGGFAHGDYLRPGAIARFSTVMDEVGALAGSGGPVLGICNGFQVLTEAGMLPGALRRNANLRFLCRTVEVEVVSDRSALTHGLTAGEMFRLPINHYDGNFTCDRDLLSELEASGQVVLRYRDNPNGSVADVAGVASLEGNVVGLMPHPERASEALLGSADGLPLLAAFVAAAEAFAGARDGNAAVPPAPLPADDVATTSTTAGTMGLDRAGPAGVTSL
jgi:phosphoribosylformylglycinamidine synthase I